MIGFPRAIRPRNWSLETDGVAATARRKRLLPAGPRPIFRLGLYFNSLISRQEVPRNRGNCAQLLATIEQSTDRRPRQLTVGAGLIESEKARYFRAIFCTQ